MMDAGLPATPVLQWRAPLLSPGSVAAAKLLGRRRGKIEASGLQLSFVPLEAEPEGERIALQIGGSPARLQAPPSLVDAILTALDPAAAHSAGEARSMLLELALLPALEKLAAGWPELDIRFETDAAPIPEPLMVGLRCEQRDAPALDAALTVSPPVLAAMLTAAETLPPAPALDPALPIPLAVRLGAADLTLAELRDLRAGDVVLPTAIAGADEVVLLAGERQAWRARIDGGALTVTARRQRVGELGLEGWTMSATQTGAVADAPIEEVPVRLVFELGRLEITIGELGAIAPGHLFALGRDERQPIDLLVGGRRIGQGEIVSIGGTLGVRVLALGRVE